MDQFSRVSDEEDGELSEVQSDAVPNEVRKWLETTFTRNSISQKRRTEDKLKFRSVANAIRAGIVVDRIYRRMSASTPFVSPEVSQLLKCIDDWSFDCFHVNQVSGGQVLKSVGYELFNRYGLMYKFKIPTTVFKNFLTQIESGYTKHKNPYHNNLHAADVTQTVHHMLWQAGLTNWLTDLEIFATLLAAIIHDYLHTGTTNNFHVMSQSETALIYNDRAVLENFHISQAFALMKNEDCNILAGLSKDEYREFRSLVIDMVLATDMSSHFQQIKAMKNILNHSENFSADKSKILSLVIHISDISHPAKDWELHHQWTNLLMEEFFRQGDREKQLDLECSPLCDRETTLVADSQLGFIEFIVSPSLEICGDVLDRVHYQMAEANTRPVLPASAKAASVVAAAAGAKSTAALAAPAQPAEGANAANKAADSSDKSAPHQTDKMPAGSSGKPARPSTPAEACGKQQACSSGAGRRLSRSSLDSQSTSSSGGGAGANQSMASTASSAAASFASSFVSSETLTSNLRKMIASSSASISRKLNTIASGAVGNSSASSSASSASQALIASSSPSQQTTIAEVSKVGAAETEAEFEARQANYRHPVIQCDPSRPKSAVGSRASTANEGGDKSAPDCPPSSVGADNRSQVATLSANSADQANSKPPPGAVAAGAYSNPVSKPSRPGATLTTIGAASRSAPPLQYYKIQRPWITCLERNKKMWREQSLLEQSKQPKSES